MSSAIVPLMDIGSDMSNALNIGADDGRKIASGMVTGMETENKGLIDVRDCPCDGCQAKPCGHPPAVWSC